jgi:hypothetical protein
VVRTEPGPRAAASAHMPVVVMRVCVVLAAAGAFHHTAPSPPPPPPPHTPLCLFGPTWDRHTTERAVEAAAALACVCALQALLDELTTLALALEEHLRFWRVRTASPWLEVCMCAVCACVYVLCLGVGVGGFVCVCVCVWGGGGLCAFTRVCAPCAVCCACSRARAGWPPPMQQALRCCADYVVDLDAGVGVPSVRCSAVSTLARAQVRRGHGR